MGIRGYAATAALLAVTGLGCGGAPRGADTLAPAPAPTTAPPATDPPTTDPQAGMVDEELEAVSQVVWRWSRRHPEAFGGWYRRDGRLYVWVVGDPAPHRAEIDAATGRPDLLETLKARWTEKQLVRVVNTIADRRTGWVGVRPDPRTNRVSVDLREDTAANRERVLAGLTPEERAMVDFHEWSGPLPDPQ